VAHPEHQLDSENAVIAGFAHRLARTCATDTVHGPCQTERLTTAHSRRWHRRSAGPRR
jgi:hypothetical protein